MHMLEAAVSTEVSHRSQGLPEMNCERSFRLEALSHVATGVLAVRCVSQSMLLDG
jgi:hypothetical protein